VPVNGGSLAAFQLTPIAVNVHVTAVQKTPLGIATLKIHTAKLLRPNQRRKTQNSTAAIDANIVSKYKSALMVA